MNMFSKLGAANFPNYWFEKSDNANECQLTSEVSGYSVFATRDYMRCVCDYWGEDVDDCLEEVADPVDSAAIGNLTVQAFTASILLALFSML